MTAFDHPQRQPFCTDPEGWGPLSPTGFHLTPCILDVIVAVVAVWGALAGAAALWLLLKKRIPQPVSKNWHFYAKLVCYFNVIASNVNRRLTDVACLIGRARLSDPRHRSSSRFASRDSADNVLQRLPLLVFARHTRLVGRDLCGTIL